MPSNLPMLNYRSMQFRRIGFLVVLLAMGFFTAATARADEPYPKPSPYPKSWELKFEHGTPQRIVVQVDKTPRAYWYLTYTVTNNTDKEQLFLPMFDMGLEDGRFIRGNFDIPKVVFNTIKKREGSPFMEPEALIGGQIRLGVDEAKDGVAIWPEPMLRMGHFSIFVAGLSGETATIKGPDGKDIILRKTLQLNYFIRGDDVYPGEDQVNESPQQWVMR